MPQSLGRRLALLRQSKGWTQDNLATILGIDRSTISKYENDANEPDLAMLRRLATALGVSTEYLLTGTPTTPTDPPQDMQPLDREAFRIFDRARQELSPAEYADIVNYARYRLEQARRQRKAAPSGGEHA
jgi:transcriptional regulator with XRE-family HTH domain